MSLSLAGLKQKKTKSGKDLVVLTRSQLQPYFIQSSNGRNSIYRCPFCSERGHKGTGYKLYMNEAKGVGTCFVCQIVIVFEEAYNLETEAEAYLDAIDKKEDTQLVWWDLNGWTTPAIESPPALGYLATRCYQYSEEDVRFYDLRFAVVNGNPLLVFPDTVDNRGWTQCFQYKNLSPSYTGPKYVTISRAPLFWLEKTVTRYNYLILVEGIFDAMSIGGVPLLGKTLNSGQQLQLREFCLKSKDLKYIVCALDGDVMETERENLSKLVKSVSNEVPVFVAHLPQDMDPEEVAASGDENVERYFEDEVKLVT